MSLEESLLSLSDHLHTLKGHLQVRQLGYIDTHHCMICIERDINPCITEILSYVDCVDVFSEEDQDHPSIENLEGDLDWKIVNFVDGVETTVNEIQCYIKNLEVLTHSITSMSERAKRYSNV